MRTAAEVSRDSDLSSRLLGKLQAYGGPDLRVMEVCGTHTVAIARMGLRQLLPSSLQLLSGPGCPVCVTPTAVFDEAIHLAEEGLLLATFGDALRVPGSASSLAEARSRGADVRVVYSALDALELARRNPEREVVFFGLGFETTSPTTALTVRQARTTGVSNFFLLSAHKALVPALKSLAADRDLRLGGLLCPGHASIVLGVKAYGSLSEEYRVPCVVSGFEPNDILAALLQLVRQVSSGAARVENAYPRAVADEGSPVALAVLDETFARVDAEWRGLGTISESGYELREDLGAFDARKRFLAGKRFVGSEPRGCRCGDVLRARITPRECPLYGASCTPETPVGACMVSSEGACGAHYRYGEA